SVILPAGQPSGDFGTRAPQANHEPVELVAADHGTDTGGLTKMQDGHFATLDHRDQFGSVYSVSRPVTSVGIKNVATTDASCQFIFHDKAISVRPTSADLQSLKVRITAVEIGQLT